MTKSYLSDTELRYLTDELNARFYALSQTLVGHCPTTKTDGAGRASWVNPDRVRLLDSTQTQRKIAVDDFATILRRIAAIK
jgi:hypothetical protein